jgi:hypothetical protein
VTTGTWVLAAAIGVAAVGAAILLVAVIPRRLVGKAQDRLAARLLEEQAGSFALLTRAEMVAGTYRRVPGVLGLTTEAVAFRGLFGENEVVATERIQKIATGRRMASGRRLLRLEVLRITRAGGTELEFVVAPDSASAWRSHLGLWAGRERTAAMDTVAPGRK